MVEIAQILYSSQFKIFYPPPETNGQTYAEECDKANILNVFFKDQTLLDEKNAEIPDIHSYPVDSPLIVREPVIGLIKWLRSKGLKVCSCVGKCAEFKNQTLKNIGWYTKVLCATEYPRGMQYLKIAQNGGTLARL